MQSRAKLLGHPIHQMLIVFPLGLLATSFFFDIAYLAADRQDFATVAFWMIAAGVCGALLAALFGFIDWLAIPRATRAKAIGAWHGVGNVIVAGLFLISWFVRLANPGHWAMGAFILSIIGVCLALVTAWLGGELVDRLGIGVDEGANVDAPSSLKTSSVTNVERR